MGLFLTALPIPAKQLLPQQTTGQMGISTASMGGLLEAQQAPVPAQTATLGTLVTAVTPVSIKFIA